MGVLKSMVSEITINNSEEQRARAFTYLPLVYGLGSIIGPAMGGNVPPTMNAMLYSGVLTSSILSLQIQNEE